MLTLPRIGELNRYVDLRRRSDAPVDDIDGESLYDDQRKRWAKIEPVGTAIYSGSAQIGAAITHRIWLRYLDGITDAYEVAFRKSVYRVRRVTDANDARRFTLLEVEELTHGE
ncbi:hypothetical protein PAP18089_01911 [Pandoraea apista]|uniref:Head-tail adaptor protein n=1 Tax=Pandoraea apista TaxID=93218 RepID=A0A5E5P564_9BURK|nr:phage head closure protein [Pandoraea apista]VVG70939.1 hypothetical protein PAP18089_01911 [Pandoraea apista]